ncbi:GGDEF domain protein [Oxalobacteraceae bacterium IMCC9480]|nr:GGDEF domain protein [Oxalobacteraceae bacterium IMCC9480]NDP60263.1 GGDEF domain-containing protein [Oxalobacteraceae bacterium]
MKPAESFLYLTKQWEESGEIMWICSCLPDGDFIVDEFNLAEKALWGDAIVAGMSLKTIFGRSFEKETAGYRQCLQTGRAEQFRQSAIINGVERHFNLCLTPVASSPAEAMPRIWGNARESTDLVEARARVALVNQALEAKVAERTSTLEAANRELERLSHTDELTGISNRRHFMALAAREIERARRYKSALALLSVDLDKFKAINDLHGHAAGDAVLRCFTTEVRDALRDSDTFARIGGDEFAILLPQAGEEDAAALAARIKDRIARIEVVGFDGLPALSATIGVAYLVGTDVRIDELMKRADTDLYALKKPGS